LKGIDVVLAVIILIGIINGYKSGFVMELFSLLAVILGILGGFKLMGLGMIYLNNHFNIDEKFLPYAAFGLVFVIIVVVVSLLGRAIKASVSKTLLGGVDQAAGAVLGLFRTVFMLSVMLWIADSLHVRFLSDWAEGSTLYPMIASFAPTLTDWISTVVPVFRDVF
jgi:membrane protein required for colicin V production